MEQLMQDNTSNVEDRQNAEFSLWFKKHVSN